MTATPYHLYRATDANQNSQESEDLQEIKDWRDINAPGTPIYDITIRTHTYYDVLVNGSGQRFPDDEAAAIAFRDAHMPGVPITLSYEDYEVEPFDIVQE